MAVSAGDRAERETAGSTRPGLVHSLRELIGTAVAALQTRLELLSTDAQEAGWRLAAILVYAIAALFCLFVGTVLLALLVIVAFWDRSPTLAVGLLSGFFLFAAVVCGLVARHYTRLRPGLFAATLETLQQDREALAQRDAAVAEVDPGTGPAGGTAGRMPPP